MKFPRLGRLDELKVEVNKVLDSRWSLNYPDSPVS